jgi:hypothetical protein
MAKICLSRIWLWCLSLPSVVVVHGFNLSPEHAIVIGDPSNQTGSYFGFAVALQLDSW